MSSTKATLDFLWKVWKVNTGYWGTCQWENTHWLVTYQLDSWVLFPLLNWCDKPTHLASAGHLMTSEIDQWNLSARWEEVITHPKDVTPVLTMKDLPCPRLVSTSHPSTDCSQHWLTSLQCYRLFHWANWLGQRPMNHSTTKFADGDQPTWIYVHMYV